MSRGDLMKAVCMEKFGARDVFSLQEVLKPVPQKGEIRVSLKAPGSNPVGCWIREISYCKGLEHCKGLEQ
jgi:NADPH:quinone reductase-like Zn-dependent oxidoreductase